MGRLVCQLVAAFSFEVGIRLILLIFQLKCLHIFFLQITNWFRISSKSPFYVSKVYITQLYLCVLFSYFMTDNYVLYLGFACQQLFLLGALLWKFMQAYISLQCLHKYKGAFLSQQTNIVFLIHEMYQAFFICFAYVQKNL